MHVGDSAKYSSMLLHSTVLALSTQRFSNKNENIEGKGDFFSKGV
jgi:hypothetical protein